MRHSFAIVLVLAGLLAQGCGAARTSPSPPNDTGGPTAAPPAATFVPATDPSPGSDPCAAYGLDGLSLLMTREEIERTIPLQRVPPEESFLSAFKESTWAFRARRPGRIDDVQVGFASGAADAPLKRLRARILVGAADGWPSSLFDALGSPKRARVGEWIWWDQTCKSTIRLTRVEGLGGGVGQPYLLELMETATAP